MKTYEVEYRRTSYVIVTVQAETPEEADEKAWKQIEQDHHINDAVWDIESVEEVKE
jgi:ribosomal protein L20A (L18A)